MAYLGFYLNLLCHYLRGGGGSGGSNPQKFSDFLKRSRKKNKKNERDGGGECKYFQGGLRNF